MVPAVSGISLLQKTKAETSGHNGKDGTNDCFSAPLCHVNGGKGGSGNEGNKDNSSNGNGGDGGRTTGCGGTERTLCLATGGNGGKNKDGHLQIDITHATCYYVSW